MAHGHEKWLDIIAKLMDNAADESLTTEARTEYHRKASALLIKHGLDEADAKRMANDSSLNIVSVVIPKWRKSKFEFKEHRNRLGDIAAMMCMCKTYMMGTTHLLIVGVKANIDTALAMYKQIDDEIERRAKSDSTLASIAGVFMTTDPTTWYNEYRKAAANTLYWRATKLVQDRMKDGVSFDKADIEDIADAAGVKVEDMPSIAAGTHTSSGSVSALVVLHEENINEYIKKEYGGSKDYSYKGKTKTFSNHAKDMGTKAGNEIDIQRKLGGGNE